MIADRCTLARETRVFLTVCSEPLLDLRNRQKTRYGNHRSLAPYAASFHTVRRMLIGYARVSQADGSQVLDSQRDALAAVGVEPGRIYDDLASGRRDESAGIGGLSARSSAGKHGGHEVAGAIQTYP
jgi:hypothetical protein